MKLLVKDNPKRNNFPFNTHLEFIEKKKKENFLPLPSLALSIAFVAILHSCNSGDGIKPAGELL